MKRKKATITITDEDGNVIEEIPMTLVNDDWIRSARLAKKARAGDKEAAEELKRMEETEMFLLEDD